MKLKVEVAVLGSPSLTDLSSYGLRGCKTTLNLKRKTKLESKSSEMKSCVQVQVAVLGSPSLIHLVLMRENAGGKRWWGRGAERE